MTRQPRAELGAQSHRGHDPIFNGKCPHNSAPEQILAPILQLFVICTRHPGPILLVTILSSAAPRPGLPSAFYKGKE